MASPPNKELRNSLRSRSRISLCVLLLVILATGFLVAQRPEPLRRDARRDGTGVPSDVRLITAQRTNDAAVSALSHDALPAATMSVVETPRVATDRTDSLGRPITISCASCHGNFAPNPSLGSAEQLKEFHQGLRFAHGKLACLACHNADNYNLLRLAGGRPLDFSQTRLLCGQCHSPQARDYERGAHGGMNGSWHSASGVRVRKTCIDCHDPHAPAFPAMIPTFKPHDRFLKPPRTNREAPPHG